MRRISIPDLAGKAFLITGASTGIGAAVARALGEQGALVGVHYNSSVDEARAVAAAIDEAGGASLLIGRDLGEPDGSAKVVEAMATHFGHLDGLINNAGALLQRTAFADGDNAFETSVLELNALQAVRASRAALPWLRSSGGIIINTTSIAARSGGASGSVIYASAKGFISTFTRGLAKELVKDRIRVNAVSPELVATPFHERYTSPQLFNAIAATIPMGRAGAAQDCVGAYLFLASDLLSGYITGQIIEVNGGQLMP